MVRVLRLFALAGALTPLMGGAASAELVFLTTGQSLSVKAYRVEGQSALLDLRSGGQVTCDRRLVARVEPDEVPYPEPPAATDVLASRLVVPTEYAGLIDTIAGKHGIDAALVRAVVQVESAYQPRARSPKGAMGLMQLMPATARQYALGNPFDPRANLEAGIRHLKGLLQRFDLTLALAAYNSGEQTVRRFGGIPPYPETQSYVRQVLALAAMAAK